MRNILFIPLLCLLTLKVGFAQNPAILQVNLAKPGAPIQPTMWGIFFEDINFGADGGIYAELVKNRSFEFYQPLMGWKTEKTAETSGSVLVQNRGTDLPNPRFVRVQKKSETGKLGLSNEGFRGMGFRQGESYVFSLDGRVPEGTAPVSLRIELLNPAGTVIGNTSLSITGKNWTSQNVTLTCNQTTPHGSLALWLENAGTVDLDMISLFPTHTWKNRPSGLRPDLVQLLADLKPGFLRFPGGCIVEGRELNTRYQWKKTVGPVQQREMIVNRWNTEFNHRLTPDYFQTFGLGFYEYFLLSEDIGAEPLPILNCGMACQFNSGEVVPMDDLDPYIQDALDLIEFANGSVQSTWGKLRADMGHPEPFDMKFLGVGNEQWGEQYIERYKAFEKILRAKHPEIKLVSAVGPFPDGEQFDYL
ncbi:MAG: alpha-L-arabinofuranosidase, partial [Haliscomenobacter sp.]